MSDLVDRLRGKYAVGPDGEFGKRDFSAFVPAISLEAADEIERLQAEVERLEEVLGAVCTAALQDDYQPIDEISEVVKFRHSGGVLYASLPKRVEG